ncbi:MAG: hypothetical protein R3B09_04675 [Nannocystaceae bacterium]
MANLPIEPYLIELVRHADARGLPLILAGGLGIYLKRRAVARLVEERGRRTLLALPEARATSDIDAFMQIEAWLRLPADGIARFRALLEELGYRSRLDYLQFTRPVDGLDSSRDVKLDLHARVPQEGERAHLKYDKVRVGRRDAKGTPLHGRTTPEAFAIDVGLQSLPLVGVDPEGLPFEGRVAIPHPFSFLCMKLKAALDHERATAKKPRGEKHAFDVYLLTAMLDEAEYEETRAFMRDFARAAEITPITEALAELFETPTHPGCRTIVAQARSDRGAPLDLERFTGVLHELFEPALAPP